VFSIDDQNGLYVKGNISASGGNIGGWSIDYVNPNNHNHGIGILKRSTDEKGYTSGMNARGDGGSVAFWAGCPGGTPWEVSDYDKHTGFFVTEDGALNCSKINATGGTVGGFGLSGVGLTSDYVTITHQLVHFPA
jgi:hypothetical protein